MSRWVWFGGAFLLCLIGGAVTLGYFMTKSSATQSAPEPLGGGVGAGATLEIKPTAAGGTASTTATIKHVTPTNTVAKRWPEYFDDLADSVSFPPAPVPAPIPSGFIVARHRNMQKRLTL